MMDLILPGLGVIRSTDGLLPLDACSDGRFRVGRDGVSHVLTAADRRVEFVVFDDRTLAFVNSSLGYPAYYPVHPVAIERPVRAVLMDLDGTTVRSEPFWVWMIEQTMGSLLGDPSFTLDATDLPYVSGFSVSEHLQYRHREVLSRPHRRGSAAVLLRTRAPRDGGDPRGPRPRGCLRARPGRQGVPAGAEAGRHPHRRGDLRSLRKGVAGTGGRVQDHGPGRPTGVLRRDRDSGIPDARRRAGHAGRVVAETASVALCRGLPGGPRHPLRRPSPRDRPRGQRRRGLRRPARGVRRDWHGGRQYPRKRDAAALPALLRVVRGGAWASSAGHVDGRQKPEVRSQKPEERPDSLSSPYSGF